MRHDMAELVDVDPESNTTTKFIMPVLVKWKKNKTPASVRTGLYIIIWGVSRKLATFGKMTVTGVYLRYLNVLLLYYPFMSNPRPCLGCATQQMWSTVLHFFLVAGFVSRT